MSAQFQLPVYPHLSEQEVVDYFASDWEKGLSAEAGANR